MTKARAISLLCDAIDSIDTIIHEVDTSMNDKSIYDILAEYLDDMDDDDLNGLDIDIEFLKRSVYQ